MGVGVDEGVSVGVGVILCVYCLLVHLCVGTHRYACTKATAVCARACRTCDYR